MKMFSAFTVRNVYYFLGFSIKEPGVVPNCFLKVVMKDDTE